jgi:hypothetical protein
MKGKHQGVQRWLLDINPRALYMSCACHSLNLTLCDMPKSCSKAASFFGILQKIYIYSFLALSKDGRFCLTMFQV